MRLIEPNISIEDLITNYPWSIEFLGKSGIICIMCGEAVWGTLAEVADSKGIINDSFDKLMDELNEKALTWNKCKSN